MNLANKYRPKDWDDITEQNIIVEILKNMCSQEDLTNRNFLFVGPAGTGKAQPLYSRILTLNGFITMGQVKVGDSVYTAKGNIGKVSGVYPQGVRPIYEITLQDRSKIRVSDEHLNVVHIEGSGEVSVVDTLSLIKLHNKGIDLCVPSVSIEGQCDFSCRRIVDIRYIDDEECQCIMVDHPDHTYISDGFIPTHNTTTARILAHELNGNTNSIIEIDAASNNSIDNIRRIVEEARTYPIGSRYKVFIIDEVHALSSQAWQVLLKTLEEQPASTIFCLATTNPEKIPETILSRVQVFKLSKISTLGINNRLKHVLDSEIAEGQPITYTDDAVSFIAKISNGGMRQALTNLDRVLAFSNDVNLENTELALNLPNYDKFFDMLNACVKHDNESITKIVNEIYNSGVNFVNWFEQFQSFVINILKFVYVQDIDATNIPSTYADKLSKYEVKHAVLCHRLAVVLMKMIGELRTTSYLQEVALVYLCGGK